MGIPRLPYQTTLGILGGIYAVEFVVLAIDSISRSTWLLENLLVFGFVALLAATVSPQIHRDHWES